MTITTFPTPLHRFPDNHRWFAKLESVNITGSMKYRSARKILLEAHLPVGSTVIESTSGNMGVALAEVCKELALKVVLVTDPKLSPYHRAEMLGRGARIIDVSAKDRTGGWLLTRLETVRHHLEGAPTWFWANQYENPLNPLAFESIAVEVATKLSRCHRPLLQPDTTLWFFGAVSTGGSLSGISRALRRLCHPDHGIFPVPKLRVVAVDVEGSAIFGRPPKERHLNGIGSSLANPPNLQRCLLDDVVIVTDQEAFEACYNLRRDWVWVGGSSGAVRAAIDQRCEMIRPNDIVVALFPDKGEIYADTIYLASWLKERGFLDLAMRAEEEEHEHKVQAS